MALRGLVPPPSILSAFIPPPNWDLLLQIERRGVILEFFTIWVCVSQDLFIWETFNEVRENSVLKLETEILEVL